VLHLSPSPPNFALFPPFPTFLPLSISLLKREKRKIEKKKKKKSRLQERLREIERGKGT